MAVKGQNEPRENPSRSALDTRLRSALAVLTDLLGAPAVRAEPPVLDQYARATGSLSRRPAAVVFPASTAQVQHVVVTARRFGLTLHPISRGRNWGYGDAQPPRDGQVVVDLSRMNRIVEINRELAYAVIEPGVTQKQLHDELAHRRFALWMDATGAGPEASIVGNALERGFGHSRYGDHVRSSCGMEVVLGDGRVLHTGFGHLAASQVTHTYPYGVGPQLDGLFAQSSLGIVTRMGVWLIPAPEAFSAFVVSTRDDELEQLIEGLGRLRRQGLLVSTVHVGNDLRVISGRMRYPWERAARLTPLPLELRRQLREELGIGGWNASGALYGTGATVKAAQQEVQRALRGFTLQFFNQRQLDRGVRVTERLGRFAWARALRQRIRSAQTALDLLVGRPTDAPLFGSTWRVRDESADTIVDPLEHHVGLMWVAPVVPLTGRAAREVMQILEPIYNAHGFDLLATLTLINERAMVVVTNISFDRRIEEEAKRAEACYHACLEATLRVGFPPYRIGPEGVARLTSAPSVFWDVVDQLKQCLDPDQVLARGRYARPRE